MQRFRRAFLFLYQLYSPVSISRDYAPRPPRYSPRLGPLQPDPNDRISPFSSSHRVIAFNPPTNASTIRRIERSEEGESCFEEKVGNQLGVSRMHHTGIEGTWQTSECRSPNLSRTSEARRVIYLFRARAPRRSTFRLPMFGKRNSPLSLSRSFHVALLPGLFAKQEGSHRL